MYEVIKIFPFHVWLSHSSLFVGVRKTVRFLEIQGILLTRLFHSSFASH